MHFKNRELFDIISWKVLQPFYLNNDNSTSNGYFCVWNTQCFRSFRNVLHKLYWCFFYVFCLFQYATFSINTKNSQQKARSKTTWSAC